MAGFGHLLPRAQTRIGLETPADRLLAWQESDEGRQGSQCGNGGTFPGNLRLVVRSQYSLVWVWVETGPVALTTWLGKCLFRVDIVSAAKSAICGKDA